MGAGGISPTSGCRVALSSAGLVEADEFVFPESPGAGGPHVGPGGHRWVVAPPSMHGIALSDCRPAKVSAKPAAQPLKQTLASFV